MNIDVECGTMNLIECPVVAVVITGVRLNSDGIAIRLIKFRSSCFDVGVVMMSFKVCYHFDTVMDIE